MPWTMDKWVNRTGAAMPQQQRHHRIVFIDLIGSRKAPIFLARRAKTSRRVDFGMGPGETFRPAGSEHCVSPLESRPPTRTRLGIKRGLGAQPPDCRLGRQLCRRPAETTCRHGPLKGPWLNKELYETGRRVGSGVGTCTAVHPTPADPDFYICGI